uniref:Uncharacterized protein n=1 Tax=Plectus sambesii TaxID=2011161 RepID=A0A914VPS0_9BILA
MDESEQQHSTFRRSNRLSRRKEPIIDQEIDVEVDTPDLEKQIDQSV